MSYEQLTAAGIHVEELMNRLMGNGSLIRLFVCKFMEDQNYANLRAAFAEGDMKKAEYASHTLKGMCGNMSLDTLYGLFSKQVNLIRRGEYAAAEGMMGDIHAAYATAITHMQAWLDESAG